MVYLGSTSSKPSPSLFDIEPAVNPALITLLFELGPKCISQLANMPIAATKVIIFNKF